jgi:hypothetical protein
MKDAHAESAARIFAQRNPHMAGQWQGRPAGPARSGEGGVRFVDLHGLHVAVRRGVRRRRTAHAPWGVGTPHAGFWLATGALLHATLCPCPGGARHPGAGAAARAGSGRAAASSLHRHWLTHEGPEDAGSASCGCAGSPPCSQLCVQDAAAWTLGGVCAIGWRSMARCGSARRRVARQSESFFTSTGKLESEAGT